MICFEQHARKFLEIYVVFKYFRIADERKCHFDINKIYLFLMFVYMKNIRYHLITDRLLLL